MEYFHFRGNTKTIRWNYNIRHFVAQAFQVSTFGSEQNHNYLSIFIVETSSIAKKICLCSTCSSDTLCPH